MILKTRLANGFRIVEVAPIENDWLAEFLPDETEVRRPELLPVRQNDKRRGAIKRRVVVPA